MTDSRKYIFAFLITAAIFATALFVSNYFSQKRIADIQTIQDRVALDILASETQSALLEETACTSAANSTALTHELGDLADKLAATEKQSSPNDQDFIDLKRQYSLLEIREYLLMKRVSEKCGTHPTFILYFYANDADCPDCQKMGYVLTALHDEFPDLRIYSFDYNLDLEAIHTLRSIYGLRTTLPALVINGDPYYGFKSLDVLVRDVPALAHLKADQDKTASSTPTRVTSS